MRRLLVDAGNSAIKWAVSEGGQWLASGSVLRAAADRATSLRSQWAEIGSVVGAYGCSVASDETMHMIEEAAGEVRWYRAQSSFASASFTLSNGYRDPTQLGPDRWHALIAAANAHRGESLLVVSAGSATTLDCVRSESNERARFVGGRIAPGVQMMFDALAQGTARLPVADGTLLDLPDNTDDAITSGVLDAQIGLIERAYRSFAAVEATAPLVVLTGGHAYRLAACLARANPPLRLRIEDNLVLRGIELRIPTDP